MEEKLSNRNYSIFKTIFAAMFLMLSINLSALTISLKTDIIKKNGNFYLKVKNTGKTKFSTSKLIVLFNRTANTNTIRKTIEANSEKTLPLKIAMPLLKGSFNISCILIYNNRNTLISDISSAIFDFGGAFRVPLNASIQIKPIRIKNKGKISIYPFDRSIIPLIRAVLPVELKILSIKKDKAGIIYTVKNTLPKFRNNYRIYFTCDKKSKVKGRLVNTAGSISRKLSTVKRGYIYNVKRTVIYTVIYLIIIILIIAAAVKLRKKTENSEKKRLITAAAIVLILSLVTFFSYYQFPNYVFWDENYHIASAQKYINGVMFMEPHPPLGKMIIAAGEVIFNPNTGVDTSGFTKTDYIKKFPYGYSFFGVRFFPTLFAALSGLLFFLVLYSLFKNILYSALFSSFYIFENALIVHSRSAMLEGPQLFLILLALWYFIRIWNKKLDISNYFKLGLITGFAMAVKVNSGILFLLFVFLIFKEYWSDIKTKNFKPLMVRNFAKKTGISILGILIPFFSIFYLHFAMGNKVMNHKYYGAKQNYKKILQNKQNKNPFKFPVMMIDYLKFMDEYNKKVPKLDLDKPGENGSYPAGWPLGIKSINYRWSKSGNKARYLYLQGNPLLWFFGFMSVCVSIGLILARVFSRHKVRNQKIFTYISMFTIMYLFYMLIILQIDRVMYLYHYFIPLLFSFFLSYLLFVYFKENQINENSKRFRNIIIALAILVILVFAFFSPLTYYQRLTPKQFKLRSWFKPWKLKNV